MTAATPALRYVDRLTYLILRWGLVALFALAFALATRRLAIPALEPALWAIVAGLLDATAGGFFYVLSLERGSTYQATTLSNTAPLWGVFGAILFLGEPLRWSVAVAAGLAIGGAWFLVERPRRGGQGDSSSAPGRAGALAALLTGILWGIAETVPAKLALERGLSPETLLFLFAVSGCLGAAALVPLLAKAESRGESSRGGSPTSPCPAWSAPESAGCSGCSASLRAGQRGRARARRDARVLPRLLGAVPAGTPLAACRPRNRARRRSSPSRVIRRVRRDLRRSRASDSALCRDLLPKTVCGRQVIGQFGDRRRRGRSRDRRSGT